MDAAELIREYHRADRLTDGLLTAHERLLATVLAQPDAEEVLLAALATTRSSWTRSGLLVALGRASGPRGVAVLREHLDASGPGSRDVRSAALSGLVHRLGPQATPDLRQALRHRDTWQRVTAMRLLADVGDDTAWDDAFDLWSTWVRDRRTFWDGPPGSNAIHLLYLLRGVASGSDRATRIVELLRSCWPVVDRHWYVELWPEVAPDGPPVAEVPLPDYDAVVRWYLLAYHFWESAPSDGLVFRVTHVRQDPGAGPTALGDLLTGGPDLWADDVKRRVLIGDREVAAYVGIATVRLAGRDHTLLALPYSWQETLQPGDVVRVGGPAPAVT